MDLLEKNAPHDDEIIDLTDIIEQGSPAPSAKPNAEPNMGAQMDTLFTKGNKEDQHLVPDAMDDIDSLLAEMADNLSASEPAPQPSKAASAAPVLNPDETLDMPNISEVDALLQALDIPPQPTGKTATPTPDELGDDIDSMLGDLLDASAKAAPKSPATTTSTDVPDGGMAIDDLDALLAEATAQLDSPPAAKPAPAPAMDMDDLDALLATAPTKAAEEPKVTPAPVPAPAMDMDDLDALLATAPTKAAEEPKVAPAPVPAPAMDMDDLDALLATAPTKAAEEPKAAPAKASTPTLDDDLNALLGTKPASPAEEPSFDDELEALLAAAAAPSPATKGGQRSVSTSAMAQSTSEAEAAPADIPSLEDDLNTLLNEVGPDTGSALDSETPTTDADSALLSHSEEDNTPIDLSDLDDSDLDVESAPTDDEDSAQQAFDEIVTLMADAADPHDVLTTAPAVDIAMVSMDDMTDMPHMPHSSPKDEEDLPELDALDALLQAASATDLTVPQADSPAGPELVVDLELDTNDSLIPEDDNITFSDEEIAQAAQELYDEKVMSEATTGDVDTSAWLNTLDEVLDDTDDTSMPNTAADSATTMPKADAEESAPMTESIDQLLAHLPEDPENSHYIYRPSSADAKLDSATTANRQVGDQAAVGENPQFEKAYEQELARLQHITDRFAQSLAAADMHIAALTNTTTSAVPPIRGMDDMLRADGPFTTALQSLVRNAVASELNPTTTPIATQSSEGTGDGPVTDSSLVAGSISGLDQRLSGLNAHLQSLQERITALEDGNKEARLQTVEARVDGQVKTIIHLEEHCKILEAHLEAQAKSQASLENRFQHEVERAAAAAAAKIIREEIAGILAGQ